MATILVVDDHPTNREFLVTLLGYKGHHLLEAADGVEALAVARANMPDLMIADILMPTMDGYELVRQLRADPVLAQTIVIFCTATYLEREAHTLAETCGVTHVLNKPAEPEEVLRVVDEALSGISPLAGPLASDEFDREHLRLLTDKLSQKVNELNAVNQRLGALIEVNQQLVLERDPYRILEKFCHAAREMIGARHAAIGVLDEEGQRVRHYLTSGLENEVARRLTPPPADRGVLNQLLKEGRPIRLRNMSDHPQAVGLVAGPGALNHPVIRSFLGAPIASLTRLYGWLYLGNKVGAEEFSEEDERVISTVAAQVAVAYENGRRYEEIQRHADELEREITERKRLHERLLQAQKMEAIGRLAGGIAHDFNNILVVITGYTELLLDLRQDEQYLNQGYLEEVKRASERAAGLTRQLLAFSRQQVLQPVVLDLNEVVINTEKMLRRLIGEDIDLITVPEPDLDRVKADAGQIEQVIMNLAINARDAMPHGGFLILETANIELDETYTRQHLEVAPGAYVMLAVSDTGIGMDIETRSHLFEPFFTTKELGKGTGLGLATVFGIVKQSGGHIEVYSELNTGTTFKIYLPRAGDTPETPEFIQTLAEPLQVSETIMVVEDEVGVRELICDVLNGRGYTILQASNGKEAVQLVEQYSLPIHLLLTDVIMPGGMNGREVAEYLVRLHPETKVLYMSGYTDDAIVHHGVLEEDVAFLQKPFTPEMLKRKIREVLAVN